MLISIVYSEEDEVVGKFLMDNRIPISYERIPKQLVNAFIAAEDADFFQAQGGRLQGNTPCDVQELPRRKDCPGRKHHHSAGDQDLLPYPEEKSTSKIEGGRLCLRPGAEFNQGGNPHPLPQQHLFRKRSLRRGGRRRELLQ